MARHNDESPVEQTCPLINRVIGYLEGIEGQDDKEFQFILDTMEEIREANSTLRGWGNEQFKEREEFEKKFDETELEMSRMEAKKDVEIKELNERIKELEDTIEEKDSIIENCLAELQYLHSKSTYLQAIS